MPKQPDNYKHKDSALMRPEAGAQNQFPEKKRKPPAEYRFDSSFAPELQWDENRARAEGEECIAKIQNAKTLEEAKAAATRLEALGKPFLNWSGKAEQTDTLRVNTMPLFVHERLSTEAVLNTLQRHQKPERPVTLNLFGEAPKSIKDKITGAYEHVNGWQNRLILGDSLEVINSLLQYENLGGQVQMVYMDPPYGIKFGGNFQPFVRKRDVQDGDDNDISREPEMVKAYRDTWTLGVHSWLAYMRDRLLLARELLTESGSCFVQISDENVHFVRSIMDEVFGRENFVSLITFQKTTPLGSHGLPGIADYIIWYSKTDNYKFKQLFEEKEWGINTPYKYLLFPDNTYRQLSEAEDKDMSKIPSEAKLFRFDKLTSAGYTKSCTFDFEFNNEKIAARKQSWRTHYDGMQTLIKKNRIVRKASVPEYALFYNDFPAKPIHNLWNELQGASSPVYVVQTNTKVIERCMLMTTEPGDLVFDPTCGSGTTAMVAEQWGRRWITTDVSRVPLALARQRLLTATFDYYQLKNKERGPAGGFVYERKQNKKGAEVGGIVPHVTLKSIANNEPPAEEVLVDRPSKDTKKVRITGPFCVEAVMPSTSSPLDPQLPDEDFSRHVKRMISILQRTGEIRLAENNTAKVSQTRPPAKSMNLNAECVFSTDAGEETAAIIFGEQNAAITERRVHDAAKEAAAKDYSRLLVIGFAITPDARNFVNDCEKLFLPALYIQASMDLVMSDLLKNMRSSQIFSECGLPDVEVSQDGKDEKGNTLWKAKLRGLDVFNPSDMQTQAFSGGDVPCWMLDTDYDGQCFRAGQVFFPRTSAWDKIRRAVQTDFDDSVWEHLAGDTSAPFLAGDEKQIAVKVIDDRGNELVVVKKLEIKK